jgi:hypothetical protein
MGKMNVARPSLPEPTYDPAALANGPLADMPLRVAQLDAALWIFDAWADRTTDPQYADFIKGQPAECVVHAVANLAREARDDIKRILAEYARRGKAVA